MQFYKKKYHKYVYFSIPVSPSVFRRISVRYHIKLSYEVFRNFLFKDFTSNQSQDR